MARNPNDVKDKFFIIERGEYVIVQHFNYEYVRNSLLKRWKRNSNERYMITIIIKEANAVSAWDVRNIDLNEVYFSNERLRVQELMISDIKHESYRYDPNMPVPDVIKRWMQYESGRNVQVDTPASTEELAIPAKVYVKAELNPNDPRLLTIAKITPDADAMKVLDWVVNFEALMHESSNTTAELSAEQLRVNSVLHKCTEFVDEHITKKISSTMKELFPDSRGLFSRMFGADIKFDAPDNALVKVVSDRLQSILNINDSQFRGAEVWFDELIKKFQDHISVLDISIQAGEYNVSTSPDDELLQRRYQRCSKMKITSNTSLMTVQTAKVRFNTELERLQEIRDVLVPTLINNLQASMAMSGEVDQETTDIINNLRTLSDRTKKTAKANEKADSLMKKNG